MRPPRLYLAPVLAVALLGGLLWIGACSDDGAFYTELAQGRPEADALAELQRWALRVPGTAHPFYWAGFALVTGR
jgi:hypothetical protein